MKAELTGTVVDGRLTLNGLVPLPDHCEVDVTVEVRNSPVRNPAFPAQAERIAAFEGWMRIVKENPIHGGGIKYSRDELHERH